MQYSIRWTVLAAVLGLAACGDDAPSPIDPVGEPPAGFAVAIPETIVRGQAFTLSVAALDDAGLPETTWSGTVTLSASDGALAPATATLVNGVSNVQVTLSGHTGEVTVRASSGAVQSDPAEAMVLSGAAPARLEIVPSSALLTGLAAARSFEVRAFDAQGALTATPQVTWASNDEATISVDAAGLATAEASAGSAMLTVSANGIESAPALVLVAQPAANAVLLPDSQIISRPVAVDAAAAYAPGWQYRVRVRGAAPADGAVVIGTGAMPLAGRVIAASDAGGGETELVVELMPLNQIFADLRIDERIPMIPVAGSGPGAGASSGRMQPAYVRGMATEFKLGPFDCEASGSAPSLELPDPTLDITAELFLGIGYDNGLSRLIVLGTLSADARYRPVFEVTFEGEATCEHVLKTFTIPASGVLSLFYGVQVPLGFGFTLDGTLEIAEVGFDIRANATADVELGITCPGGGTCSGVTTFDMTRDGSLEFIAPDPTEQFRVQLGGHAFAFARPYMGSLFTDAGSFEFVEAKAGLKQSVDLATTHYQVEDTAYASSFDLRFLATIGPGKDLQNALENIGELLGTDLNASLTLLEVDDTLATSPKGTFAITPETVQPGDTTALGDMATFTVDLDPVKYLGFDAVDRVEFLWKHENEDSTFTLGPGRPSCVDVVGSSGMRTFECETDFLDTTPGEQTFHAFVHAKLFGVALPFPLEIAADAAATVQVAADCPTDYPDPEWYGPTGVFDSSTDGGGEGAVSHAEFDHLAYTASVEGTTPLTWVSMRGDVYADDWLFIRPLGAYSGQLSLAVRTYGYVEAYSSDQNVDARAVVSNDLTEVNMAVDGLTNPGTAVVEEFDSVVTHLLDGDETDVGEWFQIRTTMSGYTRTRGADRNGSVEAEIRFEILKTATDSDGASVPIQVCSVSGHAY